MSKSNMPAHNTGRANVPKGTRHGQPQVAPNNGPSSKNPSSGGSKPNMPAHNVKNTGVSLGHTKHGVGQVPGYLKGK